MVGYPKGDDGGIEQDDGRHHLIDQHDEELGHDEGARLDREVQVVFDVTGEVEHAHDIEKGEEQDQHRRQIQEQLQEEVLHAHHLEGRIEFEDEGSKGGAGHEQEQGQSDVLQDCRDPALF